MRKIFWAYRSKSGEVIPSTIRRKRGEADSALMKVKYNHDPEHCELVRVRVEIAPCDLVDGGAPETIHIINRLRSTEYDDLDACKAADELERLQRIIDSRPAINAGLPETYIQWSQGIMQCEIAQAIGHDA